MADTSAKIEMDPHRKKKSIRYKFLDYLPNTEIQGHGDVQYGAHACLGCLWEHIHSCHLRDEDFSIFPCRTQAADIQLSISEDDNTRPLRYPNTS